LSTLEHVLGIVMQWLAEVLRSQEFWAVVVAASVPVIVILAKGPLSKIGADGPQRITITSPSGESVSIELGDMSDEEAARTEQRLRNLKAG
jgi:hypothetical protein